jgi:hypothetical protein
VVTVGDDDDGDARCGQRIHHLLRSRDEREVTEPRIVEALLKRRRQVLPAGLHSVIVHVSYTPSWWSKAGHHTSTNTKPHLDSRRRGCTRRREWAVKERPTQQSG